MAKTNLTSFFESFLEKQPIFKDKQVLQINYRPDTILHRDKEISQIANILAPALRLEKPSNLFLYGKTGTGKTLCAQYTSSEIRKVAEERQIPVNVVYINCKLRRTADTEYRLVAQVLNELGIKVPFTGMPTDEIYNIFIKLLEKQKQMLILVLDEIDQLIKKAGDGVIYNLTRLNSELKQSQLSFLGISNDLMFLDHIDPRAKSSLSEEEIVFSPYNALQLQNILKKRANKAFKKGVLSEGVIEKCSAYAAREHGDARRALELLRVSGEIAEREGSDKISLDHIDKAEEKIERDRVQDIVKSQPKQHQLTLFSMLVLEAVRKESYYTGDVYDVYKKLCKKAAMRPLTQRRLSDIIAELDLLGIINAKIISKGRFGRTREISIALGSERRAMIRQILEASLDIRIKNENIRALIS